MAAEVKPSQCWECSAYCGSLVHVEDGRAVRVTGNPEHPYSRGAFCVKGARGAIESTYHAERLLYPLRRAGARGEGRWRRVSWDEALDEIAERFGEVRRQHGPFALCGAVSSAYFSRGVAMALLLRSLGSPNVMINQDLCQGARNVSDMVTGLGVSGGEETSRARCLLVAGRSPRDSNIVQWARILERRRAGDLALIAVDPRRTDLARLADLWLPVRPGGDLALALALTRVIVDEELIDHGFVARWCHGYEELAAHVRRYDMAELCRRAGVDPRLIVQAARLYATCRPAALSLGHGVDSQVGGVQAARAYHNLIALTGNLDVPGGNRRVKRLPGLRTWWDVIHDPDFRLPREVEEQAIGARRFPLWCGPDGWAQAAHNPSVIEAILTGDPYPVRALFVSGVNIRVTYPGTARTEAALRNLDFLVGSGHTMNPTLALADVVLPKTTSLEEEEVAFNPAGPHVQLTRRAIQPRGEARSDHDAVAALMERLRARGLVERNLYPWRSHHAFNEFLLAGTGLSLTDLEATSLHAIPCTYGDHENRGFPTPTGKVELYATRLAAVGQDPLPTLAPDRAGEPAAPPGFPLTLITGVRSIHYHHSRFRDQAWARRAEPDPRIDAHPEMAAELGLADGQWVWVETSVSQGRCRLRLRIRDTGDPRLVTTGMGWWFPERREGAMDSNVNWVVPYGPPWDPIVGSPDTRGLPCRLTPAEAPPSTSPGI